MQEEKTTKRRLDSAPVDGLAKNRQILSGGSITMYSGYNSTTSTPRQAGERPASGQPPAKRAAPQHAAGGAVEGLKRNLPEGWEMKKSRSSGKVYYVNEKAGLSQFDPPAGSTVKAEQKKKQRAATHSTNLPDAQTTDKVGMMGVIRGKDKNLGRFQKWQRCSRSLDEEEGAA